MLQVAGHGLSYCKPISIKQGSLLRAQFCSQTKALKSARPSGIGRKKAASTGPVVALFGFGASKVDTSANYICVDCGYIYDGKDFSKEPNSYKCPYCSSTKRRFKKFKGTLRGRASNNPSARTQRFKDKQW